MIDHPYPRALNLAVGSLQRLDFHPIMNHYCFQTGQDSKPDQVYAYNGVTATIVELEHGLDCAIRGDVLARLCENSSKRLGIKVIGDLAHIRDGSSLFKLPVMSHEAFLYEDTNEEVLCEFTAGKDFFDAFEMAIVNLMAESYSEELSGVTMLIKKGKAGIYSYDYASLLKSEIAIGQKPRVDHQAIIMPRQVADRARRIFQMLADDAAEASVSITESQIIFHYLWAGVKLVGNLSTDKEPINFENNLQSVPVGTEELAVPLRMKEILDKSVVLMGEDLSGTVVLTTSGEGMKLYCKGPYGKAEGKFSNVPAPPEDQEETEPQRRKREKLRVDDLPELALHFNPRLVLRHIEKAKKLAFSIGEDLSLQLSNKTMRFVVAHAPRRTNKVPDDAPDNAEAVPA